MTTALVTGAVAGAGVGYVLQRGQLCFHAMFTSALIGRTRLVRGWVLGVALASVGLSGLFATSWASGLNTGLAFRPVANVLGGLVIGFGMVVASSCTSGLFYKLGSGMLGATVGLAGWIAGEMAAQDVQIPGPTVLPGGSDATFAGLLGVPRFAFAVVLLAVVVVALWCWRSADRPAHDWQWDWPILGVALGLVTVGGWALAEAGGSGFGPSTVGATASVVGGSPNWWLIAFLVGIVLGAGLAARHSGGWWVRGESPTQYGRLAAGGFLLGAGGWIAGGCNLGHGLSGAAQLNVSSWVVVASMAAGVWTTRAMVGVLSRGSSPADAVPTRPGS